MNVILYFEEWAIRGESLYFPFLFSRNCISCQEFVIVLMFEDVVPLFFWFDAPLPAVNRSNHSFHSSFYTFGNFKYSDFFKEFFFPKASCRRSRIFSFFGRWRGRGTWRGLYPGIRELATDFYNGLCSEWLFLTSEGCYALCISAGYFEDGVFPQKINPWISSSFNSSAHFY